MRNTKLVTISIPPELLGKIDELAKEEDRTRSGILREAFKHYVDEQEHQKAKKKTPLSRSINN